MECKNCTFKGIVACHQHSTLQSTYLSLVYPYKLHISKISTIFAHLFSDSLWTETLNIKNDLLYKIYRLKKNPHKFCEGRRHIDEALKLFVSRLKETHPVKLCVCCYSGLKMMRKRLFSVLLIETGANCPCNANQFRQSQLGQKERPIFLLLIS